MLMKKRLYSISIGLLAVILLVLAIFPIPTFAAPPAVSLLQTDPAEQCAEGVQLFLTRRVSEALPLLEAGFAGREGAAFLRPDDLGMCALLLGSLRYEAGDWTGALEAYAVAFATFITTGNGLLKGITLTSTGTVYYDQGRYTEALEVYQQALDIQNGLGPQTGEGTTLAGIGVVYSAQGRYVEALEFLQQSLTMANQADDQVAKGMILNNIGGVYDAQGRYTGALEFYQQALEIARQLGDQAGEGTTLNNIGGVYEAQGHYSEALEFFQQSLAIWREVDNQAGEGRTFNNIGSVYDAQGRYTDALEFYEQALEIAREVGNRAGEGTTLNNIGGIYEVLGRYTEALEFYQQALEIAHEVNDRAGEGTRFNNIGGIYEVQGRYAEALEFYQQALAIAHTVGNRPDEGTTLNNIGVVYDVQGRYAEALELYQQALMIAREVGDQDGEGTTLNNIGVVYDAQGRYAEALEFYQQALTIAREVGDQDGEGRRLNNISGIYYQQGHYAEALKLYQQTLAIVREVGNRAGEGTTLNNIGVVNEAQGHYAEALEFFQQALTIAQGVGDRLGEGTTLINIGYTFQQQNQSDQALSYYEQAMAVLESVRAVAGSEASRISFIAQFADLYARAVGLYHQQGQETEAFLTGERGRARAFLDSLATGQVELSDREAAGTLNHEREAYAARQATREALAQARTLDPPDPELVADLETQLAAVEEEHAAALVAIETHGGQLAALVPGRSTVLNLAQVQTLLVDQTTLISYYVLGEEGTLAFVITHSSFAVIELPEATPESLNNAVSDLSLWPSLEQAHPIPLRNLYTWLIAPLVERLDTPSVAIIPHLMLHYVPFAALTDGENYFGQQHSLFVLPSASSLPFIQENAANQPGSGALVFGNPDICTPNLAPLTYAAMEARSVAEVLDAPSYTGAEASEDRLWSDASDVSILHLASHGDYNQANPLYSAIHLAPSVSCDHDDDGRLEVHEVYRLDLAATDLVVLSACQTNIGGQSAGDEVVGLVRAFHFAGTPTVIASLWNVDDAATEALMVAFYKHWRGGVSKIEALQIAQADVRADPRWGSPYYWAAFVLSGDPSGMVDEVFVGEATPDVVTTEEVAIESPSDVPASVSPSQSWLWLLICGAAGLIMGVVVVTSVARRRKRRQRDEYSLYETEWDDIYPPLDDEFRKKKRWWRWKKVDDWNDYGDPW